jgi:hypothetical protein
MVIKEDSHWSLDKRVNLSHILTTMAMIMSLFIWGNKIDQRVTTLEAQTKNSEVTTGLLYKRLERIEDKLDRLIEKNP